MEGERAEGEEEGKQSGLLRAGQRISLRNASEIVCGLSWDVTSSAGAGVHATETKSESKGDSKAGIDLDASAVSFGQQGDFLHSVYFGELSNDNGSIVHTGDNRTGEGDNDDEQIVFKLAKIPPAVRAIVISISSYSGDQLSQVKSASARLLDASKRSEVELCRFNLGEKGAGSAAGAPGGLSDYASSTALIMGKLYRDEKDPR